MYKYIVFRIMDDVIQMGPMAFNCSWFHNHLCASCSAEHQSPTGPTHEDRINRLLLTFPQVVDYKSSLKVYFHMMDYRETVQNIVKYHGDVSNEVTKELGLLVPMSLWCRAEENEKHAVCTILNDPAFFGYTADENPNLIEELSTALGSASFSEDTQMEN